MPRAAALPLPPPAPAAPPRVRGQALKPVNLPEVIEEVLWRYGFLIVFLVLGGAVWHVWRERQGMDGPVSPA